MGDGYQPTEVTTQVGDNGTNPFQTEAQVAQTPPPGYQQGNPQYGADPNANGTGGVPTWRRSYDSPGLVAPGAQQAVQGNGGNPFVPAPVAGGGTNGGNPFQTGTGPFVTPQSPGRAQPGVAPAFPVGTQPTAPVVRTEGGGPTGPISQETVPSWIQTLQPDQMVVGPGAVPTSNGQGVRFGNTFVPYGADGELLDIYGKARGPVEESLLRRTKLNDLMTTGLYIGGGSGGIWKAADYVYTAMPESVQRSNPYLQKFGDHLSPITRELAGKTASRDALQTALTAAQHGEVVATNAIAHQSGQINALIAATAANPARGAAIADIQRAFFNAGDFSPGNVLAHSILDPSEVPAAKALVQAAEDAALKQAQVATAEQAVAQAATARDALRGAIPSTVTSDAAKSAWFNGRTAEKMTDLAIARAKAAGGGPLFDAAEVLAIKQFRDAAIKHTAEVAARDAAVVASTAANTTREAAANTFEALVKTAGPELAETKIGFVTKAGMTADVIEKAATFSQSEAATLAAYQKALTDKTTYAAAASKASTEFTAAEAALTNARTQLANPGWIGRAKGVGLGVLEGGAIGLGTVGVNIAADYLLSKYVFNETPKLTGTSAWGMEAAVLPFIIFNPKMGIGKKIGAAGLTYAGSHIFGSLMGEPTGRFAELGRPSWTEVGLSTAGAMLPLKDWRLRAGAATIGWGLGKIIAIAGHDEKEPKQDRDEAVAALNTAITGRDENTFKAGVQEVREIGKMNEAAVEMMRWDWFRKQSGASKDHPMVAWRGDALLAAGQGLGRIDQGSRLLNGKNHDQNKRYFPDTYADLGGEGTQALRSAAGTLFMMEDYAKKNPNEVVNGKPIGQEAQQAAVLRSQVEAELNKVYGQQDVNGIVDHIKYMYHKGGDMGALAEFSVKLAAKINATPDVDPRYKAKLCRDLAMVSIAISEFKAEGKRDGEGANIAFLKAEEAMRLAARLDPSNVNNKSINSVIERVRQKVPGAINNQYQSPATNPLGIQGPNGQRP